MWSNFYIALLGLCAANFDPVECNFFETLLTVLAGPQEPEKNMNSPQMITFHGYPVETHTVTTEDGYILDHHRIPYGKSGPSQRRQSVILQHGFMVSSSSWVWNTPDKNLPYLLADAGYDVWITNIRGGEYGLKHTTLDSSTREFWNFSWDEMAKYDMPETIDYILKITGEGKLLYIGHSMGTTIAFAMLSNKPEYNEKIKGLFTMAPVITAANAKSILLVTSKGIPLALLKLLNNGELPFNYIFPKWFLDTVCSIPFTSQICVEVVFAIIGEDWAQFNQSRIDLYLRFFPTSTSVQLFDHFGQIIQAKRFAKFDHNFDNQRFYNQSFPPENDIGKITSPVAIFWSDNDVIATPGDVATLAAKLKNVVLNHRIDFHGFAHLDFLFANDVVPLLYKPLMDAIKLIAP